MKTEIREGLDVYNPVERAYEALIEVSRNTSDLYDYQEAVEWALSYLKEALGRDDLGFTL